MLVIRRTAGQVLRIGDVIVKILAGTRSGVVSLGIDAPRSVPVWREEMAPPPDALAPLLRAEREAGALAILLHAELSRVTTGTPGAADLVRAYAHTQDCLRAIRAAIAEGGR